MVHNAHIPALAGAILIVWANAGLAADFSTSCSINGFGAGRCTFENRSTAEDRTCVRVAAVEFGMEKQTVRVCSGLVRGNDIVERNFVLTFGETCRQVGRWQDVCGISVEVIE